ncbi:hypothetical protein PR002_g4601 [Phytophthora rubi]|uniref:Uncharacterized protein n=1 Tax=Phytophthora rubi TaxID=129364 RepID=A0A6A3NCL9_9STRA|nr:hypothetical protein PR002_g4601 [Phytophthora rubi]
MEELARRQLVRLEKSTEENARLRRLVRRRELQIKAVEHSIPPLRNIDIATDLIAGMDEVYADLDNFFRQVKMHEVACPGRRNNSATYQDRNIFLDLLDCYVLPFDLRQTEHAIWTLKTTPVGKTDDVSAQESLVGGETPSVLSGAVSTPNGREDLMPPARSPTFCSRRSTPADQATLSTGRVRGPEPPRAKPAKNQARGVTPEAPSNKSMGERA